MVVGWWGGGGGVEQWGRGGILEWWCGEVVEWRGGGVEWCNGEVVLVEWGVGGAPVVVFSFASYINRSAYHYLSPSPPP